MNPMLESLNRTVVQNPVVQQVDQLRNMMAAVKNPGVFAKNAVIAQIQMHPMYSQAKSLADQYGGDWNRAFEETARQNGIDPNQIRRMLRQQGLIR